MLKILICDRCSGCITPALPSLAPAVGFQCVDLEAAAGIARQHVVSGAVAPDQAGTFIQVVYP
jgi:hypothetical protein